jgi:hypothetical protein
MEGDFNESCSPSGVKFIKIACTARDTVYPLGKESDIVGNCT